MGGCESVDAAARKLLHTLRQHDHAGLRAATEWLHSAANHSNGCMKKPANLHWLLMLMSGPSWSLAMEG